MPELENAILPRNRKIRWMRIYQFISCYLKGKYKQIYVSVHVNTTKGTSNSFIDESESSTHWDKREKIKEDATHIVPFSRGYLGTEKLAYNSSNRNITTDSFILFLWS